MRIGQEPAAAEASVGNGGQQQMLVNTAPVRQFYTHGKPHGLTEGDPHAEDVGQTVGNQGASLDFSGLFHDIAVKTDIDHIDTIATVAADQIEWQGGSVDLPIHIPEIFGFREIADEIVAGADGDNGNLDVFCTDRPIDDLAQRAVAAARIDAVGIRLVGKGTDIFGGILGSCGSMDVIGKPPCVADAENTMHGGIGFIAASCGWIDEEMVHHGKSSFRTVRSWERTVYDGYCNTEAVFCQIGLSRCP